jgi:DNA-binding response OmpR family regulator
MNEAASQKILLVDDNSRVLKLLELRFSQQGYQVFTAERVKDAVVTAIIVKPDLVVAELQLPDLDGIEFKKILGSIPALAEVPMIFLTTEKGLPVDFQAEPGAPMDYLQKPYTFQELLGKVEASLRRASVRKSALNPSNPQKGVLRDMTLTDILQVLAMNKRSCTITLKRGDQNGKIYFQAGRIVDAKAPDLRAEEAFYQLITWGGADYAIGDEQHDSLEETVVQDTRLLIAEGMRRLVKQEESARLAPAAHEFGGELSGASQASDSTQEVKQFLPSNGGNKADEVWPGHEEIHDEGSQPSRSSERAGGMREQKHNEEAPTTTAAGSAKKAVQNGPLESYDEKAFLKKLVARGLLKHKDA